MPTFFGLALTLLKGCSPFCAEVEKEGGVLERKKERAGEGYIIYHSP